MFITVRVLQLVIAGKEYMLEKKKNMHTHAFSQIKQPQAKLLNWAHGEGYLDSGIYWLQPKWSSLLEVLMWTYTLVFRSSHLAPFTNMCVEMFMQRTVTFLTCWQQPKRHAAKRYLRLKFRQQQSSHQCCFFPNVRQRWKKPDRFTPILYLILTWHIIYVLLFYCITHSHYTNCTQWSSLSAMWHSVSRYMNY